MTRPSQASPRKTEHTVTPAQDLESFKADMTSMLSDMLQASLKKFAAQFNTNSGGQGNNSNEDTVPKEKFFCGHSSLWPTMMTMTIPPNGVQRTSPKGRILQSVCLNVLEGNSNLHS